MEIEHCYMIYTLVTALSSLGATSIFHIQINGSDKATLIMKNKII